MAPRPHRAFGGDREDREARRLHGMKKRPRAGDWRDWSGVDRRFFFRRSDVFFFFLSWVYYAFKHMFGKYLSTDLFVYLFVFLISLLSFSLCTYPFCWFDCLVYMFDFFAGCS